MPTTLEAAIQIIAQLQATIAELQAENAALKQQLADLTAHPAKPEPAKATPAIKASTPTREKKPRRTRDPQHNHGRKRDPPTRIETHALDQCPDCGRTLRGGSVARTRQVIDLPPPAPVEVVEHQVIERHCPHCAAWKTPTLDLTGQVLGQGRIGVRVAALVAYLRTVLRLPIRRIQEYLATLHGLHLSSGEVTRLLHQVRLALDDDLEPIKTQARASAVRHADETGWREDGQNGYIWAFSTPGEDAVRSYEYDHSRGGVVVKRILGGQFSGHLVSDFYAGSNSYPGKHQRCWVPLLRDLHDLRKAHPLPPGTEIPEQPQDDEPLEVTVQRWCQAVRAVYDDAQKWLKEHPDAPQAEREGAYVRLVSAAHALSLQDAREEKPPCQALCKRLLRHEDELFQFVLVAGLSADNNQAERSIRPLVIIRKISGGSRSEAGTKTRMGLASLFGTWLAREVNAFQECLSRLSGPASSPA